MGCDGIAESSRRYFSISIHAPTWGATFLLRRNDELLGISIHAPTWGATQMLVDHRERKQFQSTHPRGVRPRARNSLSPFALFQSTHPRGVRRMSENIAVREFLFQSTHPRGVRQLTFCADVRLTSISIHAPTWGATHKENER